MKNIGKKLEILKAIHNVYIEELDLSGGATIKLLKAGIFKISDMDWDRLQYTKGIGKATISELSAAIEKMYAENIPEI
ncbi:hypothetical protein AAGS61_03070 [Lysinibacillus sp. KU-BSD001]|uniref:hypothetical protein n=1 Tax=Lysinibacillus sp. KU-BSD001 TaxID=3141328 RepID=UPI0036F0F8CF